MIPVSNTIQFKWFSCIRLSAFRLLITLQAFRSPSARMFLGPHFLQMLAAGYSPGPVKVVFRKVLQWSQVTSPAVTTARVKSLVKFSVR
jgi:hypothetical protein